MLAADRTFAVIPAYRAADSIERVVRTALSFVDTVIVVDDGCPESTGAVLDGLIQDERLVVLRHSQNRGVGAAVKTGFDEALRRGAKIIFKFDADDQMDQRYIPVMLRYLHTHPDVALVKGNRFGNALVLKHMPLLRLIGNSALTFAVKIASGYWTIVDPTNGFIAVRASALRSLDRAGLANRYFFEIDLLCALGLNRAPIAELQMPPIYGSETSSLSIPHVLVDFPGRLLARTVKRLALNYLITEINVGTLYAAVGLPLLFVGMIFGGIEWYHSVVSGVPRTTGTIVLALLLFIVGFQLVLQALVYDVQFSPQTYKGRFDEADDLDAGLASVAVGFRK